MTTTVSPRNGHQANALLDHVADQDARLHRIEQELRRLTSQQRVLAAAVLDLREQVADRPAPPPASDPSALEPAAPWQRLRADETYAEAFTRIGTHAHARDRHARHVGANLQELRELNDMSRHQLARVLRVGDVRVRSWERGEALPSPLMLERLAIILRCRWIDLYAPRPQMPI